MLYNNNDASAAWKLKWIVNIVSFTEGLTRLSVLAIFFLMKDDLRLHPADVSLIYLLPNVPWIIKPLFAVWMDSHPINGQRRGPYLFISSMIQVLSYLILASGVVTTAIRCSLALFLVSFSSAMSSACADAIVMKLSRDESADRSLHQFTDYISSKAIGSLAVSYWSGKLLEIFSKRSIFFITAMFPLLVSVMSFVVKDPSSHRAIDKSVKERCIVAYRLISEDVIFYPLLFTFLYTASPDYGDAYFYWLVNTMGITPAILGGLRLSYGVAALIGANFFRLFLYSVPTTKVLVYSALLSFPFYISPICLVNGWNHYIHINDTVFIITGGFINRAVAKVQLLPILMVVTKFCPPTMEATLFAIVVSVRFLGAALSSAVSSVFIKLFGINKDQFATLNALILVCGIMSLLPLGLLPRMPKKDITPDTCILPPIEQFIPLQKQPNLKYDTIIE